MQNTICMSQICDCFHFLNRYQCCSSPILALAITSMGIQYTDTRTQTWRKWTAIWKEKPWVFQQRHSRGCNTSSWHYCDMFIIIIFILFLMWRSLCVGREVCSPTPMYRLFRCPSPGTFGHSTKEYGIWALGCVDFEDLRTRKNCSVSFIQFFSLENWANAVKGFKLSQPVWAEHQRLQHYEPLPGIIHRSCKLRSIVWLDMCMIICNYCCCFFTAGLQRNGIYR